MDKRILGKDLQVSTIGYGCMGMSHAYGTVSTQKEAEQLIEKAIDCGCTFFDTAEIYGTADDPHHNEKLMGAVLKLYRNKIVLASKCGIRFISFGTGMTYSDICLYSRRIPSVCPSAGAS